MSWLSTKEVFDKERHKCAKDDGSDTYHDQSRALDNRNLVKDMLIMLICFNSKDEGKSH